MELESLLLPALVAIAAGLAVWGGMGALSGGNREKKKLAERLGEAAGSQQDINDQFRPILRMTEVRGIPPWLEQKPFIQALNRKLLVAFPGASLGKFISLAVAMAFIVFFCAFGIGGSLWVSAIGGAFAGYLPFFYLNAKRNKRQRVMGEQLPEALDFLSRVLRAGHSFSTGLQMMAEELPQPLAGEFRRCYDQHSLGQPLEEALKDMAARIESTDFAFFVTTVLIQRQTGGDLSEVLSNISGMIRQRVRLAMTVKSKTAEGRFTGYVLVAFPAVMFVLIYLLNPTYAAGMLHSSVGLMMLAAAVVLQAMGMFAIRKITTVRV